MWCSRGRDAALGIPREKSGCRVMLEGPSTVVHPTATNLGIMASTGSHLSRFCRKKRIPMLSVLILSKLRDVGFPSREHICRRSLFLFKPAEQPPHKETCDAYSRRPRNPTLPHIDQPTQSRWFASLVGGASYGRLC